jgi:hypothetical protein
MVANQVHVHILVDMNRCSFEFPLVERKNTNADVITYQSFRNIPLSWNINSEINGTFVSQNISLAAINISTCKLEDIIM